MYNEIRIFVENRPGRMAVVTDLLGKNGIDIINFQIDDEGQFGVIKILTADPEKAKKAIEAGGLVATLNPVTIIELEDKPGALVKLAKALKEGNINLLDGYGCILERGKKAIFVVHGECIEEVEKAAKSAGFKILSSLS